LLIERLQVITPVLGLHRYHGALVQVRNARIIRAESYGTAGDVGIARGYLDE
jgi:hypothetical protein